MKQLLVLLTGMTLMLLIGLSGCASTGTPQTGAPVSALATPLPSLPAQYAPTAANAQALAQATISAGAAAESELRVRGTALAMEMASAKATSDRADVIASITAQAEREQTATAEAKGTAAAQEKTAVAASANETATAAARETMFAPVTKTAIALQAISDTLRMQQLQAEADRIANDRRLANEQAATASFLQQVNLYGGLALQVLVIGLLIVGTVLAYKRFMPAIDIWLRTRVTGGEIAMTLGDPASSDPRQRVIDVLLPARSPGPGLRRTEERGVEPTGLPAGVDAATLAALQAGTTARAQAGTLARFLPRAMKYLPLLGGNGGPPMDTPAPQPEPQQSRYQLLPPVETQTVEDSHIERLLEYCDGESEETS